MKLVSFVWVLEYLWCVKKEWCWFDCVCVVIFDCVGVDVLMNYLQQYEMIVFDVCGEFINIFVLLGMFMFGKIGMLVYCCEYLWFVDLYLVIIFIDNNLIFYCLKFVDF